MDAPIRRRLPTDPPPEQGGSAFTEAELIAIDAAHHDFKVSGRLQASEADRALAMQIDRQGNYTTTGLWA